MRLRKFYDSLRRVRRSASEITFHDGCIRVSFSEREDREYCPLTAVARQQFNEDLPSWKYERAASKLGIPRAEASLIVDAADDYRNSSVTTQQERRLKQIRKAMMRALGG
jgi:hypothetical protein